MKNFWFEIAKEIGIEYGEKFIYTIDDYGYKVKIEEDGLLIELDNRLIEPPAKFINNFIKGEGKIKLLPFEPKDGDSYWTISCHSLDVEEDTWSGHCIDYHRKLQGLVFRTYEQTIKAKIDYIEKLKEIGYKGE